MVATAAAARTAEAEVTPKILQSLQQMEHMAILLAAPLEKQEKHLSSVRKVMKVFQRKTMAHYLMVLKEMV